MRTGAFGGRRGPWTTPANAPFDSRTYRSRVRERTNRVGVFGHSLDSDFPDAIGRELSNVARIVRVDPVFDPRTLTLRGFTFFEFGTAEEAERVVRRFEGEGLVIRGVRMRVDFALPPRPSGRIVTPPVVRRAVSAPTPVTSPIRPGTPTPLDWESHSHVPYHSPSTSPVVAKRRRRFSFEAVDAHSAE